MSQRNYFVLGHYSEMDLKYVNLRKAPRSWEKAIINAHERDWNRITEIVTYNDGDGHRWVSCYGFIRNEETDDWEEVRVRFSGGWDRVGIPGPEIRPGYTKLFGDKENE